MRASRLDHMFCLPSKGYVTYVELLKSLMPLFLVVGMVMWPNVNGCWTFWEGLKGWHNRRGISGTIDDLLCWGMGSLHWPPSLREDNIHIWQQATTTTTVVCSWQSGDSNNSPMDQLVSMTLMTSPRRFKTWDSLPSLRTEEAPWIKVKISSSIYSEVHLHLIQPSNIYWHVQHWVR